jgi:hypothetical protein
LKSGYFELVDFLVTFGINKNLPQMQGQENKPFAALGEEQHTGRFYTDSTGKAWPIYSKKIDFGAGPNAAAKNVAHGVASLKMDGWFKIAHAQFHKLATAPVVLDGAALVGIFPDLTQVRLTSTADLTTYTGFAVIEYTKTTD